MEKSSRIVFLFIIPLALFTGYGCEQTINMDLPAYEPKLVVHCLLMPDSLPQLYLTLSKPYFDQPVENSKTDYVKDALVLMRQDAVVDTLLFSDTVYVGSKPVTAGKQYDLYLFHDGKEVTGSTYVPSRIIPDSLKLSFEPCDEQFPEYLCPEISAYFADPPGENYYHLDLLFKNAGGDYFRVGDFFDYYIPDSIQDGSKDHPVKAKFASSLSMQWDSIPDTVNVNVQLWIAEKALADFRSSVVEQTWQSGPMSEPVKIKSNVTGGLGIFSSYAPSPPQIIQVIIPN